MRLCFNVAELQKAEKFFSVWHTKDGDVQMKKVGKDWVPVNSGKQPAQKQNNGVSAVARGDTVQFMSNGKALEGVVKDKGSMGVTIDGTGEAKGIEYKVPYSDVKKIEKPVNPADKVRFLMDSNSVQAGWRGTDGMQPKSCDTINGLLKSVEAVRGEFNDISEGVKEKFADLNPILLKRKTLKSEDRIKEKLREDQKQIDYKAQLKGEEPEPECYDAKNDTYHCRTIRDCDGHTFCMKSIDDVEKMLQYYDKKDYVARIKNNFAKPSEVGYSDINMNIKLSNGVIVEMQLNTTANMVAKERYGHSLYEVYRAIASNPKYSKLAETMANAQKALYKMSNEYSVKGNYPDDIPGGNIYEKTYKHEPYAKAIRGFVNQAIPLFKEAAANGALNSTTVEHFNNLVDYIK